MASSHSRAAGMGSSPPSSDQATGGGTPSTNTNLTTPQGGYNYSNDDEEDYEIVSSNGVDRLSALVSGLTLNDRNNRDVFLQAPIVSSTASQLSPVATTFTPTVNARGRYPHQQESNVNNTAFAGNTVSHVVPMRHGDVGPRGWPPVRDLLVGSSPDIPSPTLTGQQRSAPGVIGDHVPYHGPLRRSFPVPASAQPGQALPDCIIREGTFTNEDGTTRALAVECVSSGFAWNVFLHSGAPPLQSLKEIHTSKFAANGCLSLAYFDVRDTTDLVQFIEQCNQGWVTRALTPKQHAQEQRLANLDEISNYQGQVIVSVFYDSRPGAARVASQPYLNIIKFHLEKFGHIKAMHSVMEASRDPGLRQYRVEFYDSRAVEPAINAFPGTVTYGLTLAIERYEPDVPIEPVVLPDSSHQGQPGRQLSLTGRSTFAADEFDDYERQRTRINFDDQSRDRFHAANGPHNQVFISRIELGIDVRTTIMLRNIPNKVDFQTLKEVIDETSFGGYDFLYLRIDFSNNCNVGYAFINFIDPTAIIPFAVARAGQRWTRFNSEKTAEISYATIQGRDCLIQKFRNSSVMLENPWYRPKLFFAGSSPYAGEEEPFPGPNNASKMRRSVENAETVGLFLPERGAGGSYLPPARASTHITAIQSSRTSNPAPARPEPTTTLTSAPEPDELRLRESTNFIPDVVRRRILTMMDAAGLFAPRQGQAYRQEQRRRRSHYDRGVPTDSPEYMGDHFNGGHLAEELRYNNLPGHQEPHVTRRRAH